MAEFQKEILEAKKLFNIKSKCNILNRRIGKVINDALARDNEYNVESIQHQCYELFYLLDELKKNNEIYSFRLYKIFNLCLMGIDEHLFFNHHIGDIKDYNCQGIIEIVNKARPFIVNSDEIVTRIPQNPNDVYNDIYFQLLNIYNLSKNDIKNLLSIVYGKDENSKKAKVPKRTIAELKYLKETFENLIKCGGKEKGFTDKEIEKELIELDKEFRDYL